MASLAAEINNEIVRLGDLIEDTLPHLNDEADVISEIEKIASSTKNSLLSSLLSLLSGDAGDNNQGGEAGQIEDLLKYYHSSLESEESSVLHSFLSVEIDALNKDSPHVFGSLLEKKFDAVKLELNIFVDMMWDIFSLLVHGTLEEQVRNYPSLLPHPSDAVNKLVVRKDYGVTEWVMKNFEMEKRSCFSISPQHQHLLSELLAEKQKMMENLEKGSEGSITVDLIHVKNVNVDHLKKEDPYVVGQAFEVYAKVFAYWEAVKVRLTENLAVCFLSSINQIVNQSIEEGLKAYISGLLGEGRDYLESPIFSDERSLRENDMKDLKAQLETVLNTQQDKVVSQ